MFIFNILITIKKTTVKKLKDFIFENYDQQIRFGKENHYYSIKHHKKKNVLLLATKLM